MKKFRLLLVLGLGSVLMVSAGCSRGTTANVSGVTDTQFAESAMRSIASGDTTAESLVDFETLQGMGVDVGKMYMAMPDENNKAAFRKSFITSFSTSFKGTGATPDSFKNWRTHSSDANKSVVATDGQNGTLYLTVTKRTGKQLISGISPTP